MSTLEDPRGPHPSEPLSAEEVRSLRTFVGPSHPDDPGGPIAWVPWETWQRLLATLDAARAQGRALDVGALAEAALSAGLHNLSSALRNLPPQTSDRLAAEYAAIKENQP